MQAASTPTKATSNSTPSKRDSVPSQPAAITATVASIRHSSSGASARQRTSSGAASAAAPRVRPTLAMLLPTALPSASAGLPVNTARALTASSGSEVPKATSRSEEHTSELQSLMRISYAVFCLKKKTKTTQRKKVETERQNE